MISIGFRILLIDILTIGFVFGQIVGLIWLPADPEYFELNRFFQISGIAIVLSSIVSKLLNSSKGRTLGYAIFGKKDRSVEARSWFRTFAGMQLSVAFVWACVVGYQVIEFDFLALFDELGLAQAGRIVNAFMHPEWKVLPEGIEKMIETIFIAFMATVLAVPLAFVLGFFAARNIMGRSKRGMLIYATVRSILNFARSVEPIVWAVIFGVWVGLGPSAGMLALMVHSVASLAKLYSEQIECVNDGPIEGISATGANYLQVIWFAVVPQIVLPVVAYTIYRWDINVRMATIIGLIGGGGIGSLLLSFQTNGLYDHAAPLVFLIVLVVWAMDMASAYIREAIK